MQERRVGGSPSVSQAGGGQVGWRRQSRLRQSRLRWSVLFGLAAVVIAADQWTKSWAQQELAGGPRHIVGPINLVLTFNRGAAFSIGSGVAPLVEVAVILLVALVLWQSGRLVKGGAGWAYVVGFGLLSGGALSNLADRLFRHHHGAVVDFIQVVSWWPVFNVADAALTVGAVMVALNAIFSYRSGTAAPDQEPDQHSRDAGSAEAHGKGLNERGTRPRHALVDVDRRGRGR